MIRKIFWIILVLLSCANSLKNNALSGKTFIVIPGDGENSLAITKEGIEIRFDYKNINSYLHNDENDKYIFKQNNKEYNFVRFRQIQDFTFGFEKENTWPNDIGFGYKKDSHSWHLIDINGNEISSRKFAEVGPIINGKFIFQDFDGYLFLSSIDGKELFRIDLPKKYKRPEFQTFLPIYLWNNRIVVRYGDDTILFDEKAKLISMLIGGDARSLAFESNLLPVRFGKKIGYVDVNGKVVIEPKFTSAGSFYEEVAPVAIGVSQDGTERPANFILINKKGEEVSKKIYVRIESFSDGFACAEDNYRNNFYISPTEEILTGDWVVNFPFENGLAKVKFSDDPRPIGKNEWGVINTKGELIWRGFR